MRLKVGFFQRLFIASIFVTCPLVQVTKAAEPTPAQAAFFEGKVRPLLAKHCYECHASTSDKVKGGLLLDSKAGWSAGGDSGEVLEAGKPDKSLLIESVRYTNPDLQMPPKYQLTAAEISILEDWVEMGAPDPRTAAGPIKKAAGIDWEKGKNHWSFQPIAKPTVPSVQNAAWGRNDLDRFILSKIEAAGMQPARDADRFALIRRVSLDLTGLPPSVAQVGAFIHDPASDDEALAKVVDELLKSPSFGERWGRYWLDVARYADSVGKTRNVPFPYAWRYRNYVIDAFNLDKPYNKFLQEQIAGDLLTAKGDKDREENLIATGFLALGSMDLNERDNEQFMLDRIDDQMDTLSRATMGLTLACARCHDHKFDPISQKDYYAVAGIFNSTSTLSGLRNRQGGSKNYFQPDLLVELEGVSNSKSKSASQNEDAAKIAKLRARLEEIQSQAKIGSLSRTERTELRDKYVKLRSQLQAMGESAAASAGAKKKKASREEITSINPNAKLAMAAIEGEVDDLALRVRGEPDIKGDVVPRGFPVVFKQVSAPKLTDEGSGRKELALWLTSREHPLTSRVMVNRIWAHLMGRGLVETVDNFGVSGAAPTHPELLDHLATQFMSNGWSIKAMIRSIVLSRTYRMSGEHIAANAAIDEGNRLYWHANLRRLEAEAIRDSLLAAGGMLKSERPTGAPFDAFTAVNLAKAGKNNKRGGDLISEPIRSIYLPVFRSRLPGMFTVFDFAEPSQVNGQRDVTTVAPQALFLLNNPFVVEVSKRAADRILEQNMTDEKIRVRYAYAYTLCRYPSEEETQRALKFLESGSDRRGSWAELTQALYSSAEFRYIP